MQLGWLINDLMYYHMRPKKLRYITSDVNTTPRGIIVKTRDRVFTLFSALWVIILLIILSAKKIKI